MEAVDQHFAEEHEKQRRLLESAAALDLDLGDLTLEDSVDGYDYEERDSMDDADDYGDDDDENFEFKWDKCLPDQMFVFLEKDLPSIFDTVITKIRLPVRTKQEILVPANVLFLAARFAHYLNGEDLVIAVMGGAIERIAAVIKVYN